jgi:hypothetical protein
MPRESLVQVSEKHLKGLKPFISQYEVPEVPVMQNLMEGDQ